MTYAIDFDGVLCTRAYPNIGQPNRKLIKKLIQMRAEGDKLILWTCREGDNLNQVVRWCEKFGLEFDAVNDNLESVKEGFGSNPRKVFADYYINDRNMGDKFQRKYEIPFSMPKSLI